VSVVSSGHDVADARLHREVAALLRAGAEVEVLALGNADDAPRGSRPRLIGRRGGLVARAARALVMPWRARGRVLLVLDPDVVPAAWLVARVTRRRLVVDVHEDYRALLRDRPWARGPAGPLARAVADGLSAASAHADLTVVADDHVPPRRARRRLVVANVPTRDQPTGPHPPSPDPRAVYVGDVRRSRGLRDMLAAVEGAPGWRLDVVGPVAPEDREWLDEWRASSAAADRVVFHGRRAPEESWQIAAGAWCGFALLADTPAFRDAMPSKVLEYLAAGIPVMASPLPRVATLLEASGGGLVVPGPGQASATLRRWTEAPEVVHRHRRAALAWAAQNLTGESPYDTMADEVVLLAARGSAEKERT
jgi:glycosyltransferase involved in cell wall biosynthesis